MVSLKEQLKTLKKAREEEILNDGNLDKRKKLRALEEECGWGYESFLPNTLWKSENNSIADDIFSPGRYDFDRYSRMSFADRLEWLMEGEGIEDWDSDQEVAVVTYRSGQPSKMLPFNQVVSDVYDYCLKKKVIGYTVDW